MLDEATLEKLREALGQATLGEQLQRSAACTLETRHSLGSEGLLGVTSTRVLFITHDALHGTQIRAWSRQDLADAMLRTDLFGPRLTLRTDDGDEVTATGFTDDADGPALLVLLDRALDDVPLTMEPQLAVQEALDTSPPPTSRTVVPRPNRAAPVMVVAGAVAALLVGLAAAMVFFLLGA